jgi:hypothetical protein
MFLMEFTFGIITNGSSYINECLTSIRNLKIEKYEIVIVGVYNDEIKEDINYINFIDKSIEGDISIKKNIITKNAKYENIVFLHDYILFDDMWYDGFLKFGDDFDVCMTKIVNNDNTRYRDWCLWKDDADKYVLKNNYLIPYDITNLSSMMYISGAYWVAKKQIMVDNPLNEKLKWGQGEDVEWSLRVRKKTNFKMNEYSKVKLGKQKDRFFNETNSAENDILKNIKNYNNDLSYDNLIKNHLSKWM